MDSLDWQYEDVINKKLFADNLEIIPSKFETDESWRQILYPYILEDLRASVHASLKEDCDKVIRSRIQFSDRSVASTIGLSDNSGVDLEFQFDLSANNQQQPTKSPNALCGSLNILIRSGCLFKNGDSLLRTGHSFIYIKSFDEENAQFQCSIFCKKISHFHSLLKDKACDLLLIQVPVLPTILAIKHLERFTPPPFFKDILTAEYDQQNSTKLTYRNSLRSESIETLNASQRAAVEQIMNSTDSATAFSPAVKLIHGAPGTGKTSTLISIIHTLFLQRRCTHITAPTNKAIRVLVEKYLDRFLSDQGSNLSDIVLVANPQRLEINADHYLSNVTLTYRAKALKVAATDLPKAISEVRGYLREFGLCRMYESMAEDENNLPDFSSFCRGLLANSLDRIVQHLSVYTTQHPLLNRLEDAEKSIIPDLVARFSDRAANLETYFSDEALISWQRDMDTEDCQEESFYRNLFSAIDSDISECYKLLDKLPLPPKDFSIRDLVVQNALLVFTTVGSGATGALFRKSEEYDVCIVDEATQLVEAFTAQVFSTNLQCLILAGDHRQLPATVISQIAKDRNYERSLFDRLISNNYPSILLDTQYRMHPDICLWPNHTFYANRIINGANVSDEATYRREWSDQFSPVSIIDAADGVEKEGPNGISKCNELEEKLVRALTNDFKKLSTRPTTVGIISPYKAQVANLHDLVDTSSASFRIIVSTVDGCQGQEFDIVIFSAVRANANNAIGFLEDVRRLNVAITRPKFTLVVVCNVATVITDPIWRALVTHIDLSGGGRVMRESLLVRRVKQKYAAQQRILEELLSPSGYVFEKCSWKISFTGEFKDSIRTSSKRDKVILLLQKIGVGS